LPPGLSSCCRLPPFAHPQPLSPTSFCPSRAFPLSLGRFATPLPRLALLLFFCVCPHIGRVVIAERICLPANRDPVLRFFLFDWSDHSMAALLVSAFGQGWGSGFAETPGSMAVFLFAFSPLFVRGEFFFSEWHLGCLSVFGDCPVSTPDPPRFYFAFLAFLSAAAGFFFRETIERSFFPAIRPLHLVFFPGSHKMMFMWYGPPPPQQVPNAPFGRIWLGLA